MLTLPPAARSSLLHISSDALKWRVCHELLLERSSNFRPISTLQIVSHSISNFANIIQTSQILARILKIADEIAKSAVKKCYCRQIQVLIRNLNLDRRMAPSLQRQESRCSKMKISQHCTYFWGNDIQNVRHSWCHNLLLGGLGLCVELTKHGGTQWSDWMGTFPIKRLKEVLMNSATLQKQLFTCTCGTRPPKVDSHSRNQWCHTLCGIFAQTYLFTAFLGGLHGCFRYRFVSANSLWTLVLRCKVDGS